MTNYCNGCKDRVIGCHGKCEKYAEYRRQIEERNARERTLSAIKGIHLRSVARMCRKKLVQKERD